MHQLVQELQKTLLSFSMLHETATMKECVYHHSSGLSQAVILLNQIIVSLPESLTSLLDITTLIVLRLIITTTILILSTHSSL